MRINAGVLLLYACLVLFAGCEKKTGTAAVKNEPAPEISGSAAPDTGDGAAAAPAAAGTEKPAEIQKPPRSLTLKPAISEPGTAGQPGRGAEPAVLTEKGAGSSDFLSKKNMAVLPEDMAIGPLQDRFGETGDNTGMPIQTVVSFFNAYKSGSGWQQYLHPDLRLVLERSIQDYSQKTATAVISYRLGKMNLQGTTCSSTIRLFSAAGRTEGELYLEKKDDTWYIIDIQADLAALQNPYQKDDVFEPNVYRWLAVP